jgi:hypothetical protein
MWISNSTEHVVTHFICIQQSLQNLLLNSSCGSDNRCTIWFTISIDPIILLDLAAKFLLILQSFFILLLHNVCGSGNSLDIFLVFCRSDNVFTSWFKIPMDTTFIHVVEQCLWVRQHLYMLLNNAYGYDNIYTCCWAMPMDTTIFIHVVEQSLWIRQYLYMLLNNSYGSDDIYSYMLLHGSCGPENLYKNCCTIPMGPVIFVIISRFRISRRHR